MCQGVAAMWPLATSTVAVCFTGLLVVVVVAVAATAAATVRHGTGSMGHLGHLSRLGDRVIILTWYETQIFPVFKKCPECTMSHNNNNNNDRLTAFDPGQPG